LVEVLKKIGEELFDLDNVLEMLKAATLESPEFMSEVVDPIIGKITGFISKHTDRIMNSLQTASDNNREEGGDDPSIWNRIKQFAIDGLIKLLDNVDVIIENTIKSALQLHGNFKEFIDDVLN